MLTESRIMSVPEVPTVRPVTISVPPVAVLILAAAAVPLASADVSDWGIVNVSTPLEAAGAAGLAKFIVASTAAMPVVPISRTPVVPIAEVTAFKRAFLTAVVYVTAMFYLLKISVYLTDIYTR
jgi:hypothetical protein